MQQQAFWRTIMAGSILGWLFIGYGLFFPIADGPLRLAWWCILVLWAIGHPLELAVALPIGRDKGLSLPETFWKTMLFGITWWLPLKHGIIAK